eukprot:TRINITY_DN15174_c0_g2_i1.p1 TRINITY_DN15174_c0_g2~~TRINITY_DN15174_c0_g2_i1.p1  ORF type:complete len:389 (+),score=116.74 TRINITY_DN15174_c0_g2_i1:67-1233(+)
MADDSSCSMASATSGPVCSPCDSALCDSTMLSDIAQLTRSVSDLLYQADRADSRRWCNFLYTSKCPFCVNASVGTMDPCKFMHLDQYVRMSAEERVACNMPNLMTRHMKVLHRHLLRAVDDRARQVLQGCRCVHAWEGGPSESVAEINPYQSTAEALRKLGWVIPEPPAEAEASQEAAKLKQAPYARDIASILSTAASCLHYCMLGCDAIMFETIAWVLSLESPAIKCPELSLEEADVMSCFHAAHDDYAPSEGSSCLVLTEVAEEVSEGDSSSVCSPASPSSPPASPQAATDDAPRPLTRKERRELRFARIKQQKAQASLAAAQRARQQQQKAQPQSHPQQQSYGSPILPMHAGVSVAAQQLALAAQQQRLLAALAAQQALGGFALV